MASGEPAGRPSAPFRLCSAPFVVSNRTCNPVAGIFQQTLEFHLCYSLHRPKKRFPIDQGDGGDTKDVKSL